MGAVAEKTFLATMVLAGIDAAKEACDPPAGATGRTFTADEIEAEAARQEATRATT